MSEKCGLCGEPMPEGEQMFKFHGYSGDCPKPPLKKAEFISEETKKLQDAHQELWLKAETMLLEDYYAREKRVSDILDGLRKPTWSSAPYESNCTCAWFNECPVHGIEICPRCGENQFKDNPHRHTGFTPTERKK